MDLKKSIYTKDFTFNNLDGQVETIKLLPLTGKHLPAIFRISKRFQKLPKDSTPDQVMELMDDSVITDISEICKATLKRSLPNATEDDLDSFSTQYMFDLLPIITELNFKGK